MNPLDAATWAADAGAGAVLSLARASGLARSAEGTLAPRAGIGDAAHSVGVEATPLSSAVGDLDALLLRAPPMLLRVETEDGESRLLAVVRGRRKWVEVVQPDGRLARIPQVEVTARVRDRIAAPHAEKFPKVLDACGVEGAGRRRLLADLVARRLEGRSVEVGHLLRRPPEASLRSVLRSEGHLGLIAGIFFAHAASRVALIGGWWWLGSHALAGHLGVGVVLGWGLCGAIGVPLAAASVALQGRLSLALGGALRRRMLAGALRSDPDTVKRMGLGDLMAQVFEGEVFEGQALAGASLGLLALVDLVLAVAVLSQGAGGLMHLALLVLWLGGVTLLALEYRRARQVWTERRLALTGDLVERLLGQRTRMLQQTPGLRHAGEDVLLEGYLAESAVLDRSEAILTTGVGRGWFVLFLATLGPALVGGGASLGSIAVTLGGGLLMLRALRTVGLGLVALASLRVSWGSIHAIYRAADAVPHAGLPDARDLDSDAPLLVVRDLTFRYPDREQAILQGVDLEVRSKDRVLVEGPSGGGKSTLASLVAALRKPTSGLVLVGGLDRASLGTRWQKRVVLAPQFHENHLLSETLMFNVLMGRRWPPRMKDFEEVADLLGDLGLEDLLERMPAGLMQRVGEAGWPLSHGERSRIYLARALLAGADLVVLDESLGALDPETLQLAMDTAMERSQALLVVGHP